MFTCNVAEVPLRGKSVFVTTDQGGEYEVLGTVPGSVNVWFVRAERTNALATVTLTSRNKWQSKVRVRFDMARDTGDVAGTLAFDGESGNQPEWRL